jgi:metallophosphoesterase (TIGR00282 family)
VTIFNLLGRIYMQPIDCPFRTGLELAERLRERTPVVILDMHAEATSEKMAMGWYLDGKVSAVLGTHTHVQTADERILPHGTAFITDVGMTGPHDSIIGMKPEQVLTRFVTGIPSRFEVAEENLMLQAVVVDVDDATGRAVGIERVSRKFARSFEE